MKIRALVSTLIFILALLIVFGNFAAASDTKAFFDSVFAGDYAEVKRLIEEGTDVNAKDEFGFTALLFTARAGHTDITKLLIESGADVEAMNYVGHTALQYAENKRHTEMVKLLKEAGAK
ncbi:hypothetical protein ES702_04091 [subsurface metagenome]